MVGGEGFGSATGRWVGRGVGVSAVVGIGAVGGIGGVGAGAVGGILGLGVVCPVDEEGAVAGGPGFLVLFEQRVLPR